MPTRKTSAWRECQYLAWPRQLSKKTLLPPELPLSIRGRLDAQRPALRNSAARRPPRSLQVGKLIATDVQLHTVGRAERDVASEHELAIPGEADLWPRLTAAFILRVRHDPRHVHEVHARNVRTQHGKGAPVGRPRHLAAGLTVAEHIFE